jgi:tRNA U34 5-methylaminomethyl-2-thiouridine-forming methyltransferase MnmC
MRIITTEDGSHTLRLGETGECYHSIYGAINESRHVFIEAGFRQSQKDEINVLEIGFGTGLNAFLTVMEAEKSHKRVRYTAIELYPLDLETVFNLNYPETLKENRNVFEKLHSVEWGRTVDLYNFFTINKLDEDFTSCELNGFFDVIYFDAFSPQQQPEMWNLDCFQKLFKHTDNNGIITTYCAKGEVRRAMQSAGYNVERLPGPKGKREMLCGRKTV